MDHQQGDLVVEDHPVVHRVPRRHRRADHHVPEEEVMIGVRLDRRRSGPSLVRRPPAAVHLVLDGEGQHVGGAGLVEEALVQRGDGRLVHEEQRDLRVAYHPLRLEDGACQSGPSIHGDRVIRLLVGGVDVEGHDTAGTSPDPTGAPSDGTLEEAPWDGALVEAPSDEPWDGTLEEAPWDGALVDDVRSDPEAPLLS